MLAFNELGNNGRLGNQMFQYAALRGIAAKKGYDWCIPPFGIKRADNYSLENCFLMGGVKSTNKYILDRGFAPVVMEKQYHFDQELLDMCPNDVSIHGFFQSEKWFEHAKDEVREAFTFKPEYMEVATEMRKHLSGDVIAVHIRRTDYLTNPNHEALGLDYYARALEALPNVTAVIFTDDPTWAKEQELFPDERFFVSETDCAYTDMALMSLCDYHIIGNSTFSWWGAWLSNSKQVIAPKQWFGAPLGGNDLSDLYCDGWKVL